jgi:hypothetical protein
VSIRKTTCLAIDGRRDVLERVIDVIQTFRVSDEQISAGMETGNETIHDALLRLLVEIDHHVTAKDDVERPEEGAILQEIELVKLYELADFRLHHAVAGVAS